MKKLWLGIGLLAALVALGFGVLGLLEHQTAGTEEWLRLAAEAAERHDMDRALESAASARRHWQKVTPAIDAVTSHEETDEIHRGLAELLALGRAGRREDFLALCARLRVMVGHLAGMERPRWYNLLSAPFFCPAGFT